MGNLNPLRRCLLILLPLIAILNLSSALQCNTGTPGQKVVADCPQAVSCLTIVRRKKSTQPAVFFLSKIIPEFNSVVFIFLQNLISPREATEFCLWWPRRIGR